MATFTAINPNKTFFDWIVEVQNSESFRSMRELSMWARAEEEKKKQAEDAVREAAAKRARKLLGDNLTVKQKRDLKSKGYFELTGPSGNIYRIENDTCWNIRLRGSPRIYHNIKHKRVSDWNVCFLPVDWVPRGDQLLFQKLALETRERDALRVANFDNDVDDGFWDQISPRLDVRV